jgi:hypothetical protein
MRGSGKEMTMTICKLLLALMLLCGLAQAETIISPRSKAEHEAEMRALTEKYAPKTDAKMEQQAQASGGVLPSTASSSKPLVSGDAENARRQAQSAAMAAVGGDKAPAKGTKVRAELTATGLDKFIFAGKTYDRESLYPVLVELGKLYTLDHIVLLDHGEAIQLNHLVELSKLSNSLQLPAMYQYGNELRAINAR